VSFFSDTAQSAATYSILMVEVGPNVEGVVSGLTDLGCPEASARVFVQAAAAGSRPEIMYDVPSDEALTVATALRNQGATIEVRPEGTAKNGASVPADPATTPPVIATAPAVPAEASPAPVTAAVPVVPPAASPGPNDFPGPPQIPTLPTPAAPPMAGPSPFATSVAPPPAAPIPPPPASAPSYSAPVIGAPPASAPPASSPGPIGHSAPAPASSPASVVQAYLDAYNAGDPEAVRRAFAPGAVFDDTHGSVLAQGQDAIGALFASLVERVPGRRVTVANRLTYQGWVVDHQVADTPGQPPQSTVAAYLVHDGLIRRAHLLRE
jgi:hypothetical protein